jgi:protein TonB
MYANEFAAGRGFKPGSMTLALAMTALPIVGLVLSLEVNRLIKVPDVFTGYPVKEPPPPPPVDPTTKVDTKAPINETPHVPPVTPVAPSDNNTATTTDPFPPLPPQPEVGRGTEITPIVIAKPVIVGASYDPRFASVLQPPYPASEIRGGNSGRVVIRVLIGADGRVKQVERVAAASDAFFAAAQKQALTKWRFKPATSDGSPIEQWKTMSLRFELQEQ